MNQPALVSTITELRDILSRVRDEGRTVGFVPTMGYLHNGHGSLIRRSAQQVDTTVVSIFVNPLQFAPGEDLSSYPRDLDQDLGVAGAAGAQIVFAPTGDEMYPDGAIDTTVSVGALAELWEGASRPTHFSGVATVVAKLFNIVGPCRAYFGEKDFQQLAVIAAMVHDLSMPVTVVGCPIVREPDGLAMSSRNVYLSPKERQAAAVLNRALVAGSTVAATGTTELVIKTMEQIVDAEPMADLEYAAVIDARSLRPATAQTGEIRLLIAATFGSTRLIDNAAPQISEGKSNGIR